MKRAVCAGILAVLGAQATGAAWGRGDGEVVARAGDDSVESRVGELIARMTLDEKVSLLMNESGSVKRLGIPAYDWWNECLHGVARAGRATVFPQAIGMAATWDEGLVQRVASAIGDEARAKHNAAMRISGDEGSGRYVGLTFWTPNVNVCRDPRWGRGQETYGEDPVLTGRMGAAFVRGLQGDDPEHLKAAACAKHFAVHSGPEQGRHSFNVEPSKKDLRETYLPAFEMLVRSGVAGVMCAYNRLDAEPCCGNAWLLKDVLRTEWGFRGYVVTDCGAVTDMHSGHKVTRDAAESAALAVKSGVNIECGSDFSKLKQAVERGLVTEAEIDGALAPALAVRMRLGEFGAPDNSPYAHLGEEVVGCTEHVLLAREAAARSMVLLKNGERDGRPVLPLRKGVASVCVTGPNAASIDALMGNYSGLSGNFVTVLEGITEKVGAGVRVQYAQGCVLDGPADGPTDGAAWLAEGTDVVVAVLGLNALMEGEKGDALLSKSGGDRTTLALPESQVALMKRLRAACRQPIVVVLTGGSAMACREVVELADAVVLAWYPGEQGGAAVAGVLFGDAEPGGRLPVTFYESERDLPPFDDYAMKGRTYRYFEGRPLFPFGFGLTYTRFSIGEMTLSKDRVRIGAPAEIEARARIKNTGERAGSIVVQMYVSAEGRPPEQPIASLKAFTRVRLGAGEEREVAIPITPAMLELVNAAGERRLEAGAYRITFGGVSPVSEERARELGAPECRAARVVVEE